MAADAVLVAGLAFISTFLMSSSSSELVPDFYDEVCPLALPTINNLVNAAIAIDPRMGASLLRLHFHDCFVNGCDGSVLLDDTPEMTGEKEAGPNNNSLRGFEVIDEIKTALNVVCLGSVFSCADLLAVAARDSVVALGGASYEVQLGRRDSTTASRDTANAQLPTPFSDLPSLTAIFASHGLSLRDLVVLSASHTLGFAQCFVFRGRIYNATAAIDPLFARTMQSRCPPTGGDDNLAALDASPASFDTAYFDGLMKLKGLLHSDQQLFQGGAGAADELVRYYAGNPAAFWEDFGTAMVKMGSVGVLTGSDGEVRDDCRVVNEF